MEEQITDNSASIAEKTNKYQMMLLDMWEAIRIEEIKVRACYLKIAPVLNSNTKDSYIFASDEEKESINRLISLSIGLYYELLPKMKGKGASYEKYEKACTEPYNFLKEYNIFELIKELRNAMEELGVTRIEKEVK